MLFAIIIQLVCFGFVLYRIKHYRGVFRSLVNVIQVEQKEGAAQLKAVNQSKEIDNTIDKINEIIAAKSKNKFYTTTLDFDEISGKNIAYLNNRVISLLLLHIALFMLSIIIIAIQLVDFNVFLSFQAEATSFIGLSSFSSMYLLILIIAFLLMSIEYIYWLSVKNLLEEDRVSFLSYLDNQFQEFGSDNIKQVLSNFSITLEDLNKSLNSNNKVFKENLRSLNNSVETQIKNVDIHSAYLDKLEELNLNDLLIENIKLYPEMKKSMELAAKHYPMFGGLSEALSNTLNKSVVLYQNLNQAIKRDQDFGRNLSEFEYALKHNGHVTAKLMETINGVNTHLNQVVLASGPKVEALDAKFFEYLEKRLHTLRRALEKNDENLFELLVANKKNKNG